MSVKYSVNVGDAGRDYPHYWELCVGSCHAATLLQATVQEHIRKAHEAIGFQYIRFHGLFDDDMSVVMENNMFSMGGGNNRQISFFNIDRIFDFLLSIGMKPFVEVGFMPTPLASGKTELFHYRANCTMPAKDEDWMDLIEKFITHLEDRYGKEEVQQWFFEVWNEPNLRFFFDGTQEDYFHLYEMTARSIKKIDPALKVGGPATSNNMWIPEFRNFCETNHVPYDFITTHHYPSDDPLSTAGMNGPGYKGPGLDEESRKKMMEDPEAAKKVLAAFLNRKNENPRDVLYRCAKKAKEEAGAYPLYYTEWNGGHFDTNYAAAAVTQTLAYNEGLVEGYSYWCVSDIFEEMGLHGLPFNNEFGLVNVYGTPKPSFRLFEELHKAGAKRLDVAGEGHRTAEVLALADENRVTLFCYNHDIEERDIKAEEMEIAVAGGVKRIQKGVIDATHANPIVVWEAQGKPSYPTKEQIQEIEEASHIAFEEIPVAEGDQVLRFTAEPESITIFRIDKA